MISDTTLFDTAPLRPYLNPDQPWLSLTPNRRLASRIRGALASGRAVAAAAPVLALGDWLETLWQQLVFHGDPLAEGYWVLSPAQEACLWESCVTASPGGAALLRVRAAAEQAAQARRTLTLWRQWPLGDSGAALRAEFEANPDCKAFLDWLERFQRLCVARSCIDSAERDRRVLTAARAGRLRLPERVLGIGFDDMPPLYRELLAAVPEFTELAMPERNREAVRVGCDSLEEQLQAAALWVQQQLRDDPVGPYAIVVPDLGQQRAVVERVLLDVLMPEHALPGLSRQLPPLNFSAGDPLAQTPLVQSALQLLELAQPHCDRNTVLALLQSPFHGLDLSRGEPIAACIRAVCDSPAQRLRAGQLRAIADRVAGQCGEWAFATALQGLIETLRRERLLDARLPLARWAQHFTSLLGQLGWPGTRTLDSIEYQQYHQWQRVLAEFGQLDRVVEAAGFGEALSRLRQTLQAHVFQPKTADAPVQVLGVLEAAGLQFKGLWLCDMGDDCWPPAASPHALLPRDLQRRTRMPRCDAQREFDIAEKLSHSLLANAERVVVSYQREREEVERQVSPLFRHLPELEVAQVLGGELRESLPQLRRLSEQRAAFAPEPYAMGMGPTLSAAERARGGSALFKDQAACPFRAFARHRLGAGALGSAREGLNAAERGNLMHWALEWLWRRLESQAQLLALEPAALQQLAEEACAFALSQLPSLRLGPRFAILEQTRLTRLLLNWLEIEKARPPFEVLTLEEQRELRFAGLDLRLRVDRIDRLSDGRLLVLDYKTKNGNCAPEEWLGERPDEPQLPLYSVLLEDTGVNVGAVAFGQVRVDTPRLIGTGAEDLDAEQIRGAATLRDETDTARDWDALKQYWRAVLERLAADFTQGAATIDPKTTQVCQYCDLASLCRIGHQTLAGAESEENA